MKVKLNRDWKQNKKGDTLTEKDRPFYTLQFLIRQGWAVDVTNTPKKPKKEDNK